MPKFFNHDVAELARQLTMSPRRLRLRQLHGVERLLALIEADRAYPYELVCYHITGYRKRGQSEASHSIPGKALISDLVMLGEVITRSSGMSVRDLKEPCLTQPEVATRLGVSTKTVRRWRDRGLMGLRVVYEDGVNRLAFMERTVRRFTRRHRSLVRKGAAFTQLTDAERKSMVDRARELVASKPVKLHTVARIIAGETGRAVETVRYTLRRHDAAHRDRALFSKDRFLGGCERYERMWRCHQAGETPEQIAAAYDGTVEEVLAALRVVQVELWRKMRWDCFHSELFDAPNADALVLEAPEPPAEDARAVRVPRDIPTYLQSLYRTPLLSRAREHDLFRRYNYLKFKVSRELEQLDPDAIPPESFERLQALIASADALKQRIIQANLRLVVSIAKKHVGRSSHFFEVVSDGNVSLVRAVERFDYMRGTKFSTYATWAIVKNYARTLPEQHYRNARYVTGQDELLEAAADPQQAVPHESDRRKVRSMIAAALSHLTARERDIVSGHFGLGEPDGSQTLEQLGRRFGVTKERVRQIERRALTRLREVLSPSLVDMISD